MKNNLFQWVCCALFAVGIMMATSIVSVAQNDGKNAEKEKVYRIDFQSPEIQKAIKKCKYARVENDTLFVDIPKEEGMITAMIPISLESLNEEFRGHFVVVEADFCFSDIPQPEKTYYGAKFQFNLPGNSADDRWSSLQKRPAEQDQWGTMDWTHSKSQAGWGENVTNPHLELGIQGANGHFAIKNIRMRRGHKVPASIFTLENVPQAQYTVQQLPRMRGVMSPSTVNGPREEDFAEIEKWGGNLIRWQIGLGDLRDAKQARELLWKRFDQMAEVLEMANRHHLFVVLDVHTMSGSRPVILGTQEGRDLLVEFWQETARRFKGHPNLFGYNLMNEPVSRDIEPGGPSLNEQYHRLIAAIREIDPRRPIIVDCDGAGNAEYMEFMEVFPYKNIIYSPHFYKPFELTHQLDMNQETYLSYPNPERGWDKEFLRKQMEPIIRFQELTGARIYVAEFSCIRWAPGSERFIADCIELFEEYGWDWSYHAFREWQGWDVEYMGKPNKPIRTEEMTPRKEALLNGLRANRCGEE